jgi:hypothetical protein
MSERDYFDALQEAKHTISGYEHIIERARELLAEGKPDRAAAALLIDPRPLDAHALAGLRAAVPADHEQANALSLAHTLRLYADREETHSGLVLAHADTLCAAADAIDALVAALAAAEQTAIDCDLLANGAAKKWREAEARAVMAETALRRTDAELENLGLLIAAWCPHGFDSSRTWEYGWSGQFTESLSRARDHIAAARAAVPAETDAVRPEVHDPET